MKTREGKLERQPLIITVMCSNQCYTLCTLSFSSPFGQIINNGPVIAKNRPADHSHSGSQPLCSHSVQMVLHINGPGPSKGELCARVYVCVSYLAVFISLYYVAPRIALMMRKWCEGVWRYVHSFVRPYLATMSMTPSDRATSQKGQSHWW